jgi:hypothetical protein
MVEEVVEIMPPNNKETQSKINPRNCYSSNNEIMKTVAQLVALTQ